jgi:hypothetical protein
VTRDHDSLRELIAPVALGAAEPQEITRVEAHAAECPVCREELAGLRAAAGVLAVVVPQEEPPPALKEAIMRVVRAEAGERADEDAAAERPPAPRRRPGRWPSVLGPWPALAAVAAAAVLLLGWNIALQTGDDGPGGEVASRPVAGTVAAPGVTGRVIYVPGEDAAVVRLSRLPPLDPGEAYQLWVLRDGTARSAGLFEPTGPAQAQSVASGLAGADGLAVTAQPRTSRAAPEGPILVEAPLQSG